MMEVASGVITEPALAALSTDATTLVSTDSIPVVTVSGMPILSSDASIDGLLNATTPIIENVQMLRDGSILSGVGGTPSYFIAANPDGSGLILLDTSQLLLTQQAATTAAIYDGTNIFRLASQDVSSPISTSVAETVPTSTVPTTLFVPNDCNPVLPVSEQNPVEAVSAEGTRKDDEIQPPIRKGPHKCEVCQKEFPKWRQLHRHLKLHIEDKPNKCDLCDASFNLESNLLLHKAVHCTSNPTCPECGKKFSRIASLKAHVMLHEKEENLICTECGDEFSTQFKLDRHVAEHREELLAERYYHCKQCPKVFSKITLMREHMKMHYKIKASLSHRTYKRNIDRSAFGHKCFDCGKQFQKQSQLIRHNRIHTGERPFKCNVCNKAFNQKGALQIHMIKHSGERPHHCEFCPATFSQRGNLRVHIQRVHSLADEANQPLYRCEECSCVFRKLGSLNAHMSRMHTGDFNLQKDDTQNETGENDGASEATQQVHDVLRQIIEVTKSISDDPNQTKQQIRKIAEESKMNADILQQALENSGLASSNDSEKAKTDRMKKAMLSKAMLMTLADTATGTFKKHLIRRVGGVRWYQCMYCFKEFKKPSDLVRHIRIHTHEKPFKCDQCFRAFAVKSTLTAHMRTHIGIKEFKCDVCSKMFATQGTLKVHFFLHSNIKPFMCNICDKSFRTTGHKKSHMLTHHKDNSAKRVKRSSKAPKIDLNVPEIPLQEPILITDTGYIQPLSKNSNLYNQFINEEQSDERPYRCTVCNRAFKKSSHLKQHVRSHTGEKPFACHQCNRAFVSNGVLKAHIKTHSGVKPYRCEICNSKFTTNGSLRRHMCIHSNERPYMCPYCQKTFKTSMNCKKHMKTHRHELAQGQLLSETVTVVSEVPGQEVELREDGENASNKEPETIAGHIIANLEEIAAVDNQGHDEISLGHQPFSEQETVVQENLQHSLAHQVFDNQAHLHADLEQATLVQQTSDFEQPQASFFSQTLTHLTSANFPHSQFTLQADAIDVGVLGGSFVTSSTTLIPEPLVTTSMASILQSQGICEPPDATSEAITDELGTTVDSSEQPPQEKTMKSVSKKGGSKKNFRCPECHRNFKKSSHLKQHMRLHNGEKPYKCTQCGRSFVSMGVLRTHIKTHSDSQEFKCEVCKAAFSTKSSLKRHMALHDTHKPFQCPHCPETFRTKTLYSQHLFAKHKGEDCLRLESEDSSRLEGEMENSTISAVPVDGKRPRNSVFQLSPQEAAELAKHNPGETNSVSEQVLIASAAEKDRISEIKDKNVVLESLPKYANQCYCCPKSFKKPSDLVRHLRIHTGEKPYACKICSKSFTVKSTLDSHVKTHTGEKNFSCHVCCSLFATKGSLKVHMRLHTGAKPFKCPHCDLRFRTSGHRKSHIVSHFKGGSLRRRRRSKADRDERTVASGETSGTDTLPTVTVTGDVLNSINSTVVGSDVGTTQTLQTVDGIQLQLTPDILGQTFQITSLDPSLLNKPLQIDASLLQQIQRHININITVSPSLVAEQNGSAAQSDSTVTVPITDVSAFQENLNIDSSASHVVTSTNSITLNPNVIIQQLAVPLNSEPQSLTADSHIRHTDDVGGTIFTITDVSQASELHRINSSHQIENEEHNLLRTDVFSNNLNQSNGNIGINAEENTVTVPGNGNIVDNAEMQTLHFLNLHTIDNSIDPKSSDQTYVCSLLGQDLNKLNDSNIVKGSLISGDPVKTSRRSQPLLHECHLCEKAFTKKSQLERHIRIHTGERPFVCSVCFKAFNQKNALQIHMTKHTGEKRYKCEECEVPFTQKGNLKEHMKRVHFHS